MKWAGRWLLYALALAALLLGLYEAPALWPDPFFSHCTDWHRLRLCSDTAFDERHGQALLAQVGARLARSPLDDRGPHHIFISNGVWHTRIFMRGSKAAAFGLYPLTRNIFGRHADIGANTFFHADGTPAAPPRTLVYYLTHEITHTLVGEHLGSAARWGHEMPVWVREGYPDYVGMGGGPDNDPLRLYTLYRNHDPAFVSDLSYFRYRMLVAYFLERRGWSLDRLFATGLSTEAAQRQMDQDPAVRPLK